VKPTTLGELKAHYPLEKLRRSVREEARENLIARLRSGAPLFPGIHGYEETVVPALVDAILAGHDVIFLGTRGQAKTRLTRMLTALLDEEIPALPTPLRDNPLSPISPEGRRLVLEAGDDAPIVWVPREARYVEKLATPDVGVADLIGDLDPIKAARLGREMLDLEAIQYGLLPRANRGIFAIQELPDLAPRVQVALFGILEEGEVQIRGFPLRLPLDVWLVFTANPEDYTARGRIVTPLKDRIEAEIRTHDPRDLETALRITLQEAQLPEGVEIFDFMLRASERVAFVAREDPRVDPASGVSQRLSIALIEGAAANALRRHLVFGDPAFLRPVDLLRARFAITGKIEPSFEGEEIGAEALAGELVAKAFLKELGTEGLGEVRAYFEAGGKVVLPEGPLAAVKTALKAVPGLLEAATRPKDREGMTLARAEGFLEALVGEGFLTRTEDGYARAS